MKLCDIQSGQLLSGFYLLRQAVQRTTTAGKPYFSGVLTDQSGSVDLKIWDYSGPITPADDGKVVWLQGRVSEFKGALQVTADRIRLATKEDSFSLDDLVPSAPVDRELARAQVVKMLSEMEDSDYRAVCQEMLRRHEAQFLTIPAAKSVHHGFLGGLLMHTCNMMRTARWLAALYGDFLDKDLLLAGTFLHDFAKMREFSLSPVGLVSDYSVSGQLLGHLVMGAQEAAEVCRELNVPEEKSVLLQHLILSHHGEPEFGAAVVPQCAESELLSYIDMIDSRMEIYRETLEKTPLGAFSDRVFALDNKRIFHHKG